MKQVSGEKMVPGWASPQVPHALLMALERCMVILTFEAEAQRCSETQQAGL